MRGRSAFGRDNGRLSSDDLCAIVYNLLEIVQTWIRCPVISFLEPRSYRVGGFEAGGDWSIGFGTHEGIKCYAVTSGACWLALDGAGEPVLLKQGDFPASRHVRQNRLIGQLRRSAGGDRARCPARRRAVSCHR